MVHIKRLKKKIVLSPYQLKRKNERKNQDDLEACVRQSLSEPESLSDSGEAQSADPLTIPWPLDELEISSCLN